MENCADCGGGWNVGSPAYPGVPATLYHYCRGQRVHAYADEIEGGNEAASASKAISASNAANRGRN